LRDIADDVDMLSAMPVSSGSFKSSLNSDDRQTFTSIHAVVGNDGRDASTVLFLDSHSKEAKSLPDTMKRHRIRFHKWAYRKLRLRFRRLDWGDLESLLLLALRQRIEVPGCVQQVLLGILERNPFGRLTDLLRPPTILGRFVIRRDEHGRTLRGAIRGS